MSSSNNFWKVDTSGNVLLGPVFMGFPAGSSLNNETTKSYGSGITVSSDGSILYVVNFSNRTRGRTYVAIARCDANTGAPLDHLETGLQRSWIPNTQNLNSLSLAPGEEPVKDGSTGSGFQHDDCMPPPNPPTSSFEIEKGPRPTADNQGAVKIGPNGTAELDSP